MRAPEKTLAVVDHNIPTSDRNLPNPDPESAEQIRVMAENAHDFGIEYFDERDRRQGIVHIIGPEQGFTLPGTTIVCGDSHTATHGAFGALAHGIGTSEVEHVLATQTLIQKKSKNMRAVVDGKLPPGVTAKDIILAIIGEIGMAGGTGHVIEYTGEAIRALSMEGRMTVCNMSIEGGARAGMVAPDEKTFEYLKGRPQGAEGGRLGNRDALLGDAALRRGRGVRQRDQARCREAPADRHLGHQSRTGGVDHRPRADAWTRPTSTSARRCSARSPIWTSRAARRSPTSRSTACSSAHAPTAASRTCATSRASRSGHKVNANVYAMIVPGSGIVKEQAEAEGLDKIFKEAGFDWREPGCSMCLAMNPDKLTPGERCASTSNRNFEGRQGYKGRTHLVSPAMAAAAAIAGKFVDVREWK